MTTTKEKKPRPHRKHVEPPTGTAEAAATSLSLTVEMERLKDDNRQLRAKNEELGRCIVMGGNESLRLREEIEKLRSDVERFGRIDILNKSEISQKNREIEKLTAELKAEVGRKARKSEAASRESEHLRWALNRSSGENLRQLLGAVKRGDAAMPSVDDMLQMLGE